MSELSPMEAKYLNAVVGLGDELVRDAWPSWAKGAGESSGTYAGALAALSIVKAAYETLLKADEQMASAGIPPIPPAFLLTTMDRVVRVMLRHLIDRVPADQYDEIFEGIYRSLRP